MSAFDVTANPRLPWEKHAGQSWIAYPTGRDTGESVYVGIIEGSASAAPQWQWNVSLPDGGAGGYEATARKASERATACWHQLYPELQERRAKTAHFLDHLDRFERGEIALSAFDLAQQPKDWLDVMMWHVRQRFLAAFDARRDYPGRPLMAALSEEYARRRGIL